MGAVQKVISSKNCPQCMCSWGQGLFFGGYEYKSELSTLRWSSCLDKKDGQNNL